MAAHALSVVALAALVASAAARPDFQAGKNSYSLKNAPATNPKENAVITSALQSSDSGHKVISPSGTYIIQRDINTEVKPNPALTPAESGSPATECTTAVVVTDVPSKQKDDLPLFTVPPTEAPVPERFSDHSKPVNLRYPHAVLFGGTCGGSIIHPKWILTAGHCTLFTGGRYILAGTNNSDDGSGVTKKVKKLHIHPLFSVGPYWLNAGTYGIKQVAARWDFLLAELEEPLVLDGVNIDSVPLGDKRRLAPGTYVGYAGYGTAHHGGFMRSEMHAMHLQTQTNATCSKLEQFNSKDMICARGYAPNFDSACNGDSGSGLVSGSGKLVGVASWVENDAFECRNGNLVVFSKVASVRDWISHVAGV